MDEPTDAPKSHHLARWLLLLALAAIAAAFGRQMALGAADRKFEERLRALDAEGRQHSSAT